MSNYTVQAALNDKSVMVVFSSYCSDGPGYAGPLTYDLAGDRITLIKGEVITWMLPDRLPQITGVRDYQVGDLSFVAANLCDEDREYLQDADGSLSLDNDRVKILNFADGQVGTLIVHGEPRFFCLVCGSHRYSVKEANVDVY